MTQIVDTLRISTQSNLSGRVAAQEIQETLLEPPTDVITPGVIDHLTPAHRAQASDPLKSLNDLIAEKSGAVDPSTPSESAFPHDPGCESKPSCNAWNGHEAETCLQEVASEISDSLFAPAIREDIEYPRYLDCKSIVFYNPWDGQGDDAIYLLRIEFETTQGWRVSFGPIHPLLYPNDSGIENRCRDEDQDSPESSDRDSIVEVGNGGAKFCHATPPSRDKYAIARLPFLFSLYILTMWVIHSVFWSKLLYAMDDSKWGYPAAYT